LVNVAQGHIELAVCRAASTFAPVGSSVPQFAEASRAVVKSRDATATHPASTQAVVAHCRFMCPSPSFGRSRSSHSAAPSLRRLDSQGVTFGVTMCDVEVVP
jgi:hypothetical protein